MMETRSAIGLIIMLGILGNAVATEAAPKPAAPASEAAVPSLNLPATRAPVIGGDASTGAAQRSASAGYELSGAGIGSASTPEQGAILTNAGRGKPIRFQNGVFVYPAASLAVGHNDNVGGSDTNETSSKVVILRPEVVAEMKRSGDRYTLSYAGNFGRYTSSANDNFRHHDIWLAGDNYFTTRARLGWGVGYQWRSDARGSTDRVNTSDSPDEWRAPVARLVAIYGAPGARGRLELESSWMQKRYTNNRINTRTSDVDMNTVAGRFFFRVMPKTSMLFEARNTWSDYISQVSTSDNSYRKLLVGATWDMTAKTTGVIKLGRAYKDYDANNRRDPSGGTWEAGISWAPLTYSVVSLQTAQDIADSSSGANNYYIDNRSYTVNWDHKWESYVTSNINAGVVRSEYNGIVRDDTTKNYGVGFYRELGYNFRAGMNWNRTKRDSNVNGLDFKRDVFMLTLETVL